MPAKPTAMPDKATIRALIWKRGYTIAGLARKIGRPTSTIYAITGKPPAPVGVDLIRQIAHGLSTPAKPVKPSDISDWTGDDDTESEPEPKVPAA
jgi:hypothetical protein